MVATSRLDAHARKHGPALARLLGRPLLDAAEFEALRREICARPDRVFTGLTFRGQVEYHFARVMPGGRAMIVTTRDGYVRTLMDVLSIERWVSRRAAVEVTARVVGQ